MEAFKRFVAKSSRAKFVSLFIAISIWYLIRSHLESGKQEFPVPGTAPAGSVRPATGPVLDESLLAPLIPPPGTAPLPVPIPVPGGDAKG